MSVKHVQMADYVANMLWQKYNWPNTQRIIGKVIKHDCVIESKFPYSKFGKQLTLIKSEKILAYFIKWSIMITEDPR